MPPASDPLLQWGCASISADGASAGTRPRGISTLQWGRASISADGSRSLARTTPRLSFNGAALRSALMADDLGGTAVVPDASMGPRFDQRGWVFQGCFPLLGQLASMGPRFDQRG